MLWFGAFRAAVNGLMTGVFHALASLMLLFVLLQPSQWRAPAVPAGGEAQEILAWSPDNSLVGTVKRISSWDPAAHSGAFLDQALRSEGTDPFGLLDSEDPNEEDPVLISPSGLPSRVGNRHHLENRALSLRLEQLIHRPPIA